MAIQFMPNSPRPPKGTIWSFPAGIRSVDGSTGVWLGAVKSNSATIGRIHTDFLERSRIERFVF
jgi:hypothetical protein